MANGETVPNGPYNKLQVYLAAIGRHALLQVESLEGSADTLEARRSVHLERYVIERTECNADQFVEFQGRCKGDRSRCV
jgi:hypothetical protein